MNQRQQQQQQQKSQQTKSLVAVKDITSEITTKIKLLENNNEITFPPTYNYPNALKGAMLVLEQAKDKAGKPVLQVCTRTSIAQSLFDMVVQGLSAIKTQCYFVAYGDVLKMSKSYFGSMLVAKRCSNVKDTRERAVHAKDNFAFIIDRDTNLIKITKHEQTLESLDSPVVAAYCTVIHDNDTPNNTIIMTIKDIVAAWNMGGSKGNSPAHKNFSGEMAKKTVLNRALKKYINSSDDSDLLTAAVNNDELVDDSSDAKRFSEKGVVEAEIEEAVVEEIFDTPKKVEPKPNASNAMELNTGERKGLGVPPKNETPPPPNASDAPLGKRKSLANENECPF